LAGVEWTQVLWDDLIESGALAILKTRLPPYLTQARTSERDEEWNSILLYVMLQLELWNASRERSNDSPFELLLQEGGVLHRWQDFKPNEQPLAFILRLHILVNCNIDDSDTNWQEHILGLVKVVNDPSVPWMKDILFNAATMGVKDGKENIRRMCGQLVKSNSSDLGGNWTRDYALIPQALCRLCLDGDPGVREGAIEALMRTSVDHQLRIEFESAFEELVGTRNREQTLGVLAAVTALAQNGERDVSEEHSHSLHTENLRKHMNRGTTQIAKLVENEQHECWDGSVNASLILSRHAELQTEIKAMIPRTSKLLASEIKVQNIISDVTRCFALQEAVFTNEVKTVISSAVKLLENKSQEVACTALQIIQHFACQGHEFQSEVKLGLQKIVKLLADSSYSVRGGAVKMIVNLASQASKAHFHSEIKDAIPSIVNLLADKDHQVQFSAVEAIGSLVTQSFKAEFHLEIRPGIPRVIELLSGGSSYDSQNSAVKAIGNIAAQ
ncbi:6781_t:CDS:2, partial [Acaulospora colombiana]